MSVAVETAVGRTVLEVEDVRTRFHTRDGTVHAVNGISFDLREGELLGVVGESGSGKSVTMMSLLKLLPMPPAEIASGRARTRRRGPDGARPRRPEAGARRPRRIRVSGPDDVAQPGAHRGLPVDGAAAGAPREWAGSAARRRAVELLERVGIPAAASRLDDFPHQFSGGMRQRVMIAIALACNPRVLIADEPTTALDVTIQAQILDLVKRLRRESGMAIVWITHDLGVMAGLADRVMVMYGGLVVERASVAKLYRDPRHPYTRGLLATLPRLDGTRAERLESIPGQPPNLDRAAFRLPLRSGVAATRSTAAGRRILRSDVVADGHEAACWLGA